jgi:hypothetical protein
VTRAVRNLLLVMNPRRIEECVRAFKELPIDKLWIRSHTEYEIEQAWPEILERSADYDRLIIASDDGVVRPHALAEVIRLLDEGHPVVTGYSNLSSTDFRVNLTKTPQKPEPGVDAYDLYTLAEVMEHPTPEVHTFLVGMCITGMSHAMWQRFPFRTFTGPPGNASDFCLSQDLERAGVPMIAGRDAFVWHVKQVWNTTDTDPRKRLYLGEPNELVLEVV